MYKGYFEALGIIRFASDSIGAHWILNGALNALRVN